MYVTIFNHIKPFYETIQIEWLGIRSVFLSTWFNRNIIGVLKMFYKSGNVLYYE